MPVRRVGDVHGHWIKLPARKQADQIASLDMRPGHVSRQPKSPQSRHTCGNIGVAIINYQCLTALHVDSLTVALQRTRENAVHSPTRQALYERNRYSPAIRSHGFLFVSGQVGSLDDGTPQPGLKAQVRQAFQNLNAILAEAGCSFDDVVDVTVFMVDPASTFEEIWTGSARLLG